VRRRCECVCRGQRNVVESEMQLGFAPPFDVMAGLVPAIHAALPRATLEVLDGRWACGRMLRIRLGMPGTRPRLSGSSRRRHRRAEPPPPLWGGAGGGGGANHKQCGPLRGFGEVGATPLPNPPPQGGREFQRSIRPSNPCPQRCRSSQSSAICELSKLRRFPQPDSRGARPGMTCCDCTARIMATESCSLNSLAPREIRARMSGFGRRGL
jgi:hypothetical protein